MAALQKTTTTAGKPSARLALTRWDTVDVREPTQTVTWQTNGHDIVVQETKFMAVQTKTAYGNTLKWSKDQSIPFTVVQLTSFSGKRIIEIHRTMNDALKSIGRTTALPGDW